MAVFAATIYGACYCCGTAADRNLGFPYVGNKSLVITIIPNLCLVSYVNCSMSLSLAGTIYITVYGTTADIYSCLTGRSGNGLATCYNCIRVTEFIGPA